MSADILTFPGEGLPDRPITEQEVDRLHSKNFRNLEGRINDCAIMAAIAHEMVMAAIVGIEPKHEKAQFAVCKLRRCSNNSMRIIRPLGMAGSIWTASGSHERAHPAARARRPVRQRRLSSGNLT